MFCLSSELVLNGHLTATCRLIRRCEAQISAHDFLVTPQRVLGVKLSKLLALAPQATAFAGPHLQKLVVWSTSDLVKPKNFQTTFGSKLKRFSAADIADVVFAIRP